MNNENLRPVRTTSEARERGRNGGKASGESRRRQANFRKALNLLLTTEIDSPEWTPVLQSLGLDSTLEAAVNMAMIKKALAGNVKAYEAIAKYSGQAAKTDKDMEEQDEKIKAAKLDNEEKRQKVNDAEGTGLGELIAAAWERRKKGEMD